MVPGFPGFPGIFVCFFFFLPQLSQVFVENNALFGLRGEHPLHFFRELNEGNPGTPLLALTLLVSNSKSLFKSQYTFSVCIGKFQEYIQNNDPFKELEVFLAARTVQLEDLGNKNKD